MELTLGFSPCPNDTFIFDASEIGCYGGEACIVINWEVEKQILAFLEIDVSDEGQPAFEETQVQASVPLCCSFPAEIGVAEIIMIDDDIAIISTCCGGVAPLPCIIGNALVSCNTDTGSNFAVVKYGFGKVEEFLIGKTPSD